MERLEETKLKKVVLERIHHRDKPCVAIRFPYDKELLPVVRQIEGATFSQTLKSWYVPERENTIDIIFKVFQKHEVWVDDSALNSGAEIIQKPTPAERKSVGNKIVAPALSENHTKVLRLIEQKLNLKGYSGNTVKTYLQQFKEFQKFYYDTDVTDLAETEIRNYLLYLVERKKVSRSYQHQAINAIKFFYEKILMEDRKVYYLERPMSEKRLPKVLSQENLMSIFEAAGNIKHRVMLMLIYAAGLRRSELLGLRRDDVDIDRNTVFIRGGKGRKDRQSIMAQSLVPLLREYIDNYSPSFWLFEGRAGERYTESSLQQVLKQAVEKAGITKRVTLHMLRHSFATHLLEAGTSTRYIQELLGHESPVTTEIYAQVTRFGLDKIKSPLDQIVTTKHLRGDEK